jgi:hypothetical protein
MGRVNCEVFCAVYCDITNDLLVVGVLCHLGGIVDCGAYLGIINHLVKPFGQKGGGGGALCVFCSGKSNILAVSQFEISAN